MLLLTKTLPTLIDLYLLRVVKDWVQCDVTLEEVTDHITAQDLAMT